MKKIILLILICLIFIPCLFAQEYSNITSGLDYLTEDEDYDDDSKKGIKERSFEWSLIHLDVSFSNNFISMNQMFSKVIDLNLNKFPSVLKLDAGVDLLTPLNFCVNSKKGWGFGLKTGVQATGIIGLNFDVKNITAAKDKKSDFGFASYVNIEPHAYFHIGKFKFTVNPTIFMPVVYSDSAISYTIDGTVPMFYSSFDIKIYLPFDYDGFNGLTSTTGIDLSVSAEYPLSKELGLQNIHRLLDFDVGASFTSIPIVPGKMRNYIGAEGELIIDAGNNLFKPDITFPKDIEFESKIGNKSVLRPFAMHLWADWRPFNSEFLTVTPLLGFAINPIYVNVFSMETGISGHLNLGNLFHVILGINYLDRIWINSLDLALNLRFFQLDFGINLQSPSFARSWTGSGFGVNLGMKFGW